MTLYRQGNKPNKGNTMTALITNIEDFIKANFNAKNDHEDLPKEMRFVNSVLLKLEKAGYKIHSIHTGEDLEKVENRFEALDHIFSVDESRVFLMKGEEKTSAYIVLGNFDGTAFADWNESITDMMKYIDEAGASYFPDQF